GHPSADDSYKKTISVSRQLCSIPCHLELGWCLQSRSSSSCCTRSASSLGSSFFWTRLSHTASTSAAHTERSVSSLILLRSPRSSAAGFRSAQSPDQQPTWRSSTTPKANRPFPTAELSAPTRSA